ncbi:hypothetical protein AHAS_Ahas07G0077700 [Arachis hypogaea]
MTRSQPNPSLAEFDSEIERILLHTRQAKWWLDYTTSASASLEELSETLDGTESDLESTFNEGTSYSSIGTTDTSLHTTGENRMAEPRRITLHKKEHWISFFNRCKLDMALMRLLSWSLLFPFSLEGKAKEWFYSQPDEVVTEWNLLRREFLDKFFPPEKTDYIWKKIFSIMQRDQETLYEYWTRFKRFLESCPHHGLDTHLLISYFTRGLCASDKRLLTASSGGSLSKNKMVAKAWSLINDIIEATQHVRVRNNPPKSVVEARSSDFALTKVLGEMTTLLKEIHQGQKASQSIQAIEAPPQILQLEGPPRVCSLFCSTAHYTNQCHQVQEDYTLAVANNYNNHPPYQSQGQNNYSYVMALIKGGGTMLKETTTIKDGTKATHLLITTTTTNLLLNITTIPTKTTITNHTNTHKKTTTTTIDTKRLTKDNKPINLLLLPQTKVMTLTMHSTKNKRDLGL